MEYGRSDSPKCFRLSVKECDTRCAGGVMCCERVAAIVKLWGVGGVGNICDWVVVNVVLRKFASFSYVMSIKCNRDAFDGLCFIIA